MATLFPKIYDIIDKNPFRDVTLDLRPSAQEFRREQSETWDCFLQVPLNPPGSLSQFLLHTDPVYEIASPSVRKSIQQAKALEIEERVDTELVGRKWSRKKIHDAFGQQVNQASPPYSDLIEQVLCELYQFQKVILHRRSKQITFCPPDLRLWKSDIPVHVGDDEGCWAYEVVQAKNFLTWLTEKEDDNWKISWPTADGKLEELRSEVLKRNLVAHKQPGSDSTKLKKEDWARTLGRSQAIETLSRLRITIQ